jgi:hypothetical protein
MCHKGIQLNKGTRAPDKLRICIFYAMKLSKNACIIRSECIHFWHRCLERQAFGTPQKYTLSPSKSIKGSNYGEFLKDKNVLLCTRLYKYAPNLESLLTQQLLCLLLGIVITLCLLLGIVITLCLLLGIIIILCLLLGIVITLCSMC